MSKNPKIEVTASSGNVFADLGLPEPQEELLKAQLAHRIHRAIKRRRLTQVAAAALMGIDQPKVSALLNGRLTNFSSERLMRLLAALGEGVDISVIPAEPGREKGQVQVARQNQGPARIANPSTLRFDDPRQARTHRRLGLVGAGPQAFYRDAVRLINGPIVESTSHLVGHLLREIESALRDVLEPIAHYESQIKKGTRDTHEQEVRIILRNLDIDDTDGPGAAWLDIARTGLHSLAHRRSLGQPRPFDINVREIWDDVEGILDVVLERFESRYLDLHAEIDRLLSKVAPSENDLKYLENHLPNNPVTRFYFFGTLKNAGWLRPLYEHGFFSEPPIAVRDEAAGTISFPQWPVIPYLERMAIVREQQSLIVDILLNVPEIDNPTVYEGLLAVALKLPASRAVHLVDRATVWLGQPLFGLSIERAGELAARLALAGRKSRAFDLLVSALDPVRASLRGAGNRNSLENHAYGQIVQKHLPVLTTRWPMEALKLLTGLLTKALQQEQQTSSAAVESHLWRRTVASATPWRRHEVIDMLVDAVRDCAVGIARNNSRQLPIVHRLLSRHRFSIFRRIALHALAANPTAAKKDVERYLRSRELFDSWTREPEYVQLLSVAFAHLPERAKKQILKWIEAGPSLEHVENRSEVDLQAIKANWQRSRLIPLRGQLPATWETRLEDLGGPYKDNDPEGDGPYVAWVGPRAPRTSEELRALTTEELVEFLHAWRPRSGWREASPEGLGRTLTKFVSETPETVAATGRLFRGLAPTYVRSILRGFEEALKNARPFAWPQVLDLCEWAISQPRFDEDEKTDRGQDPGWSWTRSAVASLIAKGVTSESNEVAYELRDHVWRILEPITWDPDPSPKRDADSSSKDAYDLAINSVRGEALIAVVRYAVWVESHMRQTQHSVTGMPAMPEVRSTLLEHLNVAREPSPAIRAVFGEAFPTLHWVDPLWTTDQVEAIFPTSADKAHLREAAWAAYLRFRYPYNDLFPSLRRLYEASVDALDPASVTQASIDSVESHLGSHIMSFYWSGLDATETLARKYFERAGTELRGAALEFIGRSLEATQDDIPAAALERLRALWEWWFENAPGLSKDIEAFGWWLASGRFASHWSIPQAIRVLKAGYSLEPDHMVVKYLITLAKERPADAARILDGIWEHVSDEWSIYGWRDEAREVLQTALRSADKEAVQIARALINKLAARGHLEFRDLLPA
jgi:predicted XRE-type DNA-binding protein